jgi:mono/diheme cytochrome c family protein
VTGQADETLEKTTAAAPELLNRACVECHTDTLLELGFNNHFHNQLAAARSLEEAGFEPFEPDGGLSGNLFTGLGEVSSSSSCLDCHQAHRSLTDGSRTLYIDVENVLFPACVTCHEETGEGPLDLGTPGG